MATTSVPPREAQVFFFRQELIDIMDRLKIPQDFLGCSEITLVFPGFSETTSWYAPWVNHFIHQWEIGEVQWRETLNIGLPSDCLKIGTISSIG